MFGVAFTVMPAASSAGRPAEVVSVVRPDPHTGRLVRTVVAAGKASPVSTPKVSPPERKASVSSTVDRVARQNQLSPELIHSVIQAESNYDPYAVSPKGALGIMQLIPATARRFGVSDVFNPEDNIQGGARYLKYLLQIYKGNDALALAAYNAGEGAVSRYGGIPPFAETQNYVLKVQRRLGSAPQVETPAHPATVQTGEVQSADPASAETRNHIREVTGADGKTYYISY
ncbi:MAG: lytic transglycosylase domain-containing protein [Bryobacteraceae bacterium]